MSESMSSPWIRDYFMNVAEAYGAQIYNAPVSNMKKRVQLTDVSSSLMYLPMLTASQLLTYQEDSYVWAWISDKDYRVSVRISKDAADQYKRSVRHPSLAHVAFSVLATVFMAAALPTLASSPFLSPTIALCLLRVLSVQMRLEIRPYLTYHSKSVMSLRWALADTCLATPVISNQTRT